MEVRTVGSRSVSPRPATASAPKGPAHRRNDGLRRVQPRPASAQELNAQMSGDEPEHPALREYREMEAAIKAHNDAMVKQAKIVENALFAAEVAASNTSTTLFSNELTTNDVNGLLRQEVFESVKFGPRLRAALAHERITECRRILLNSEDGDSPESVENAVTGLFATPLEALEVMCRNSERMICDAYALMVDLCSELQPKKSYILQPYAASLRRILATQMLNTKSALSYCWDIRNEMERLEGFLESTAKRKDEACRAALGLLQEVQSLRSQIFKSIADVQPEQVPEHINPVLSGHESSRAVVMLQLENTHHLRVSRPKLISEALLQAKIVIEGAVIEHGGRRTNFNSATEAKDVFDHEKNVMMPPESYMMEFDSITDALECCAAIQLALLNSIHWSHHLNSLAEFSEVRADPSDEKSALVWGGLRARVAIHVGAFRTAFPFAGSETAANCPFLSGMAADRLMQILRITRGGEVLMSEHAGDAFLKHRFEDPRCCPTLQLIPVATSVSKPLQRLTVEQLLARERPGLEPRSVQTCVFPAVSFWRNSIDGEDLSKLEFGVEGDVETRSRFTSKEYEARIEALLQSEAVQAQKMSELEASIRTCQAELQANLDASQQAIVDSQRAASANIKLMRRAQRLMWKQSSTEERCMEAHDVLAKASEHSTAADKELGAFRKAEAARKRLRFVEIAVQTVEEGPKTAPLAVVQAPAPAAQLPLEPCPDCTVTKLQLSAVHSTLRTLSDLVSEVQHGGWNIGELMPIFSKRTRCSVKDTMKKIVADASKTPVDLMVDSVLGLAVGTASRLAELVNQRTVENEAAKADSVKAREEHDAQRANELQELRKSVEVQKLASELKSRRFDALRACFSEVIRLFSNFRREMEEVADLDQLISGLAPILPYYMTMCSELDVDAKRIDMEPAFDDISALLVARSRRRMIAQEARPSDFDDCLLALKQTLANVRKALVRSGEMSPRLMSIRMSPSRSNLSPRLGQSVNISASASNNTRGVVFVDAPASPRDDLDQVRPEESTTFSRVMSSIWEAPASKEDAAALRAAVRHELEAEYEEHFAESLRNAEAERVAFQEQIEGLSVRLRSLQRPDCVDATTGTNAPAACAGASTQTIAQALREGESQTVAHELKTIATQTSTSHAKPTCSAVATMTDAFPAPVVVVPSSARVPQSMQAPHSARSQPVLTVSPSSSSITVPTGPTYLSPTSTIDTPERVGSDIARGGSASKYARDRPVSSGAVGRLQRSVDQSRLPLPLGAAGRGSSSPADSPLVSLATSFRQPDVLSVELGTAFGFKEIVDDGGVYIPQNVSTSPPPGLRPGTASSKIEGPISRVSSAHNKDVPRSSKFVVVRRANLGVGLGFDQ